MTVATAQHRLQDASGILFLSPYEFPHPTYDPDGHLTIYGRMHMTDNPDSMVNWVSMRRITVDGLTTERQAGWGYYIFNIKDDNDCRPDHEGYCGCHPVEYQPLPYRSGEVCETCYLRSGFVWGIGKEGCTHK